MARQRPNPSAANIGAAVAVIGKVVNALTEIPDAVRGFVNAFNPGSIAGMDQAFRSLQATIGYALEPIIQATTEVFKTLAGELNDVFTDLRPIIAEISGIFLNLLAPVIQTVGTIFRNVADTLRSLMPIVRLVTKTFEGIINVAAVFHQIVNTILLTAVQAIAGSFGGLDTAVDAVESAFVDLAIGIIKMTDAVLRFVGATEVADKLLRVFSREPDKNGGRAAAPTGFAVSSIADVYRKRLEAAAKGQGTGLTKTESILDKIRQEVEKIRQATERNDPARRGEIRGQQAGFDAGGFGPARQGWEQLNRWANRQQAGRQGGFWNAALGGLLGGGF